MKFFRDRSLLFLTLSSFAFALSTANATAAEQKPEFPAPAQNLELSDGDCIVFLGDSITHQCLYTQYVEDYFYTRFPHMRFKFHNAGVGGAKAWDALQRFDRDVAAYHPKYVTILLGMNDGSYKPFDESVFDTYQAGMLKLIEKIESIGAKPILMAPTIFDARAARMKQAREPARARPKDMLEQYNSVLAYYGEWLRDTAMYNGYGFVDMHGPLDQLTLKARTKDPKFTMVPDSIHPGPPGQLVMAHSLLSDLEMPTSVSRIKIRRTADGSYLDRAEGGKISDIKEEDGKVQFTWLADSLPWVVPDEAAEGAELLHLGPHMNYETFELHGLATGRYVLRIDGQEIGTYTSHDLSRGIEMHKVKTTPQYQQAMQVAQLNHERNDGPVRSKRNEWGSFQLLSRLKVQDASRPANEKRDEQLTKLEERLQGMEERVAAFEAEADKIEDKIFEVNQPKPRKYELTKVE